jgi:hypothetical protein
MMDIGCRGDVDECICIGEGLFELRIAGVDRRCGERGLATSMTSNIII